MSTLKFAGKCFFPPDLRNIFEKEKNVNSILFIQLDTQSTVFGQYSLTKYYD